jgi:hypothetical protein
VVFYYTFFCLSFKSFILLLIHTLADSRVPCHSFFALGISWIFFLPLPTFWSPSNSAHACLESRGLHALFSTYPILEVTFASVWPGAPPTLIPLPIRSDIYNAPLADGKHHTFSTHHVEQSPTAQYRLDLLSISQLTFHIKRRRHEHDDDHV